MINFGFGMSAKLKKMTLFFLNSKCNVSKHHQIPVQIFGYKDYFSLYYANRKSKTGEVSLKSVQNILIQNKIQDKRYFSRFRVLVDIVNKNLI